MRWLSAMRRIHLSDLMDIFFPSRLLKFSSNVRTWLDVGAAFPVNSLKLGEFKRGHRHLFQHPANAEAS